MCELVQLLGIAIKSCVSYLVKIRLQEMQFLALLEETRPILLLELLLP